MNRIKHLRRLGIVYESQPHYFITTCAHHRRNIFTTPLIHQIMVKHWEKSMDLYGWAVGSYVVMPDHVHFFCRDVAGKTSLSKMVGAWKQWTSKELVRALNLRSPIWQREFFDHLLRSDESYSEKWAYVFQNPVRAGLVEQVDEWDFWGYIHYR